MHVCVCVHGKDTHNVRVYLQACERTVRGTYMFAHMWKTHEAGVYMLMYKTQSMHTSAGKGGTRNALEYLYAYETPVYVLRCLWTDVGRTFQEFRNLL